MASGRGQARDQMTPDEIAAFFTRHWETFNRRDAATLAEANRELPPGQLLQHLVNGVKDFTVSDMLSDDRTALIVRYSGE